MVELRGNLARCDDGLGSVVKGIGNVSQYSNVMHILIDANFSCGTTRAGYGGVTIRQSVRGPGGRRIHGPLTWWSSAEYDDVRLSTTNSRSRKPTSLLSADDNVQAVCLHSVRKVKVKTSLKSQGRYTFAKGPRIKDSRFTRTLTWCIWRFSVVNQDVYPIRTSPWLLPKRGGSPDQDTCKLHWYSGESCSETLFYWCFTDESSDIRLRSCRA